MKKLQPFSITILLSILVFAGCDTGSFFMTGSGESSISVDTIQPASFVKAGGRIPISVNTDRSSEEPDLIRLRIEDELGTVIHEEEFSRGTPDFPALPDLELSGLELSEGRVYGLILEFFLEGEFLHEEESWFFYGGDTTEIRQVTVSPHSAAPGETVKVLVEIGSAASLSPYLQFRLDGNVVYEGLSETSGSRTSSIEFELTAPEDGGVYDLRLDLYPWFDSRISEDSRSTIHQTLEMLVIQPSNNESPQGVRRITEENSLPSGSSPFFYTNARVASGIQLTFSSSTRGEDPTVARTGEETDGSEEDSSDSESPLFSLSDGRLGLEAISEGEDLLLNIHYFPSSTDTETSQESSQTLQNSKGEYLKTVVRIERAVSSRSTALNIDILESDRHLTLLVSSADKLLYGELLYFEDFDIEISEPAGDVENGGTIPGSQKEGRIGPGASLLELTPLAESSDLESLFQMILRKKYGNFILFAEGFEFASSVNNAISYSDQAYVQDGYLVLPPAAWVELPGFALDEYLVNVSAEFHDDDSLLATDLELLQLPSADDRESASSVFSLSGNGEIRVEGVPMMNIPAPKNSFDFTLSQKDDLLSLVIPGVEENALNIPVNSGGIYRLYINRQSAAQLQIRLDSVQATNTADELVDRVFEGF